MIDGRKSQTMVRLTLGQLSRLIAQAKAGLKEYIRNKEDAGIQQMEDYLARPRAWWEKLFRVKRPDTSRWRRSDWLDASTMKFYPPATSLRLPPWDDFYFSEERKVLHTLGVVLKYAKELGDESGVNVDARDVDVLENIALWAPVPSVPSYRNEIV